MKAFIAILFIVFLNAQEKPSEEEANQGKISGITYFDFSYTNESGPIFDIKRSYFKYLRNLSDKISYKITFDVGRDLSGADTDEKLSVYLKNAGINIKIKNNGILSFGLIGMNMFNVQEKTWGYRYISKSAMDEYGFSSSADFGLGYQHKMGNLSLNTLLTNGEGYKSSGDDGFPKFSLQFLYGSPNLKLVKSGNAFNMGIVLSVESFESPFAPSGTVLNDEGGEYFVNPLATDIFSGSETVIGLFGGFTTEIFMAGFEYNQSINFDDAFTGTDGGDNQFGNDDELTPLYSTYGDMKTSSLISTYFSLGFMSKFNMFFRADMYDPNTVADALDDSETHILMGIHYPLNKSINSATLIKHNILESSEEATTDIMVNFEFKF